MWLNEVYLMITQYYASLRNFVPAVIAATVLGYGSAHAADECGARLEVTSRQPTLALHLGHYIDSKDLHIVIRNTGEKSLNLVLPGDGSSSEMRTPIVI